MKIVCAHIPAFGRRSSLVCAACIEHRLMCICIVHNLFIYLRARSLSQRPLQRSLTHCDSFKRVERGRRRGQMPFYAFCCMFFIVIAIIKILFRRNLLHIFVIDSNDRSAVNGNITISKIVYQFDVPKCSRRRLCVQEKNKFIRFCGGEVVKFDGNEIARSHNKYVPRTH